MNTVRKIAFLFFAAILAAFSLLPAVVPSAKAQTDGLMLFTAYRDIDVTPGQTVTYTIDVINKTSTVQTVDLRVEGLPADWQYKLTAGGWNVRQLSVKPNDYQSATLEVKVPLKVDKGDYRFRVVAGAAGELPLSVRVTEQGTYNVELTTEQPNMEGSATSTFTYSLTLKNGTADKQTFALTGEAPRGWSVSFKVDGKDVSSVTLDPGTNKSISVEIRPPENASADKYKIPVKATSGNLTAQVELEAVVTGSYKVELTTPNGLLSTSVTAGGSRTVELQVANKGSAALTDIDMQSSAPTNWEVKFEPQKIHRLEAGQTMTVKATIKADKKAIAGDYVVNMSANAPESRSEIQFRVQVKSSVLWGWIGVLIIAAVIAFVYYLFQKYGRR